MGAGDEFVKVRELHLPVSFECILTNLTDLQSSRPRSVAINEIGRIVIRQGD